MIPQETVTQILDSARIEEVVGDFVTLKRRGADYVACCPFHNEKTPSFHVSPTRGIYKCFGCGKAGSAVGFVMEYEHMSYAEALRYLAEKYHIEIHEKEETAEEIASRQKRESLFLVSEFAAKFYRDALSEGEGRTLGYAYCRSRGMGEEIIAKFGIGWAPSGRTALVDAAIAAGYKPEYLVDAGLCIKYDDGSIVDRFRERVMFPVHALSGRVVAFSGRTLHADDKTAKYVNSPETEIYTKGHILFGIYLAKNEIARQDKCYLVEGNVDVVSLHQLGICNVVAPCGTALTLEQVRLIKRFTSRVTVMFDGDKAGIKAAQKSITMILKEDMDVKVVFIPDGDDPDSYSRKHTLQEVKDFLDSSEQDFISFKTNLALEEASDPYKRSALINDLADTIAAIPDAVKRSVFVEMVSQKFGTQSDILFQRISSDREKEFEAQAKEEERYRRREAAGLDPHPSWEEAPGQTFERKVSLSQYEECRTVAKSEEDLLRYLLMDGRSILEFADDSPYYGGDEAQKPSVADFIIGSVEDDGGSLINPAFQTVFSQYVKKYDEGEPQDAILKDLLNSPDRDVAFIAAELSTEKHVLSVKSFEASMTAHGAALARDVPRVLLDYAEKKIDYKLQTLSQELTSTDSYEDQQKVLEQMTTLNALRRSVRIKLGREKNNR